MINSFKGDYSWLSNMADCEINYKGWTFKSVENAYMWAKNPNDEAWLDFCLTNSPSRVQKEGQNSRFKTRLERSQVKCYV